MRKRFLLITLSVFLTVCFGFLIYKSGAWFTAQNISQTNTQVPYVGVDIYYGNTLINNSEISLSDPRDIKIKASSSFNVSNAYLRAKVMINCYDDTTGYILTNYSPSDYVSITLSNFENVSGYDNTFVYYHSNNSFNLLNSIDSVTIIQSGNITKLSELPSGVTIKLSVYAEAIQKDDTNFGLSRWRV